MYIKNLYLIWSVWEKGGGKEVMVWLVGLEQEKGVWVGNNFFKDILVYF